MHLDTCGLCLREPEAQVGEVAISHSAPTTALSSGDLPGGTSLGTGKHVLLRVLVISSFASRRLEHKF